MGEPPWPTPQTAPRELQGWSLARLRGGRADMEEEQALHARSTWNRVRPHASFRACRFPFNVLSSRSTMLSNHTTHDADCVNW